MKRKKTIGIPKSLIYYRYGVLLKRFFQNLNCKVIINTQTPESHINNKICIPYQKYINDLEYLKDKCDYVLISKVYNYGLKNKVCNNLSKLEDNIITKRQKLEFKIKYIKEPYLFIPMLKIGIKLTINIPKIIYAYLKANKKQKNHNLNKENYQKHLTTKSNKKILLLSPFYILEDIELINKITTILKENNIIPIYSSRLNKKYISIYKDYYQAETGNYYLKEIISAYNFYKENIDGIIYLFSNNCEMDSIIKNTTILKNNTIPIININICKCEEKKIIEFVKKII